MNKKNFVMSLLVAITTAACGGGNSSSAQDIQSSTTETTSARAVVAQIEREGKLPILDRSTDIKGTDADNNGIRDDIDAWIAAQPYTEPQKKAAIQLAKAIQKLILVDLTDATAVRAADNESNLAVKCVISRGNDSSDGYKTLTNIEKLTANTKERVQAYLKYNATQDGTVSKSPKGDGCVE